MSKVTLVLHNIRSTHNVGSIFRTADAAGVTNLVLIGYTPTPLDRFGRERKDVAKVALGAQKTIPWIHVPELADAIEQLKKDEYTVVAVEQDKKAISLFDFENTSARQGLDKNRIALVLGNEVDGLSPSELALADVIVEIPMRGQKESLNVSVAAGVALFTLLK